MSLDELDRLSRIDISQVDRTKLIDIRTIQIDPLQSAAQRMESYIAQIRNPYLFSCDGATVRVRFDPDGGELPHRLKNHFASLKNC